MNYKQVKKLLRKHKIPVKEFNKWMRGQTGPILENGELGYYEYDVERFINHKTKGTPLIWD
jgi:hypothetical protein